MLIYHLIFVSRVLTGVGINPNYKQTWQCQLYLNRPRGTKSVFKSGKRVTKGFDAKNRCTHRTYSYYAPTVCFATKENWSDDKAQTYRIDKEKLDKVNSLLGMYNGTKSYHNFTSGKLKGIKIL